MVVHAGEEPPELFDASVFLCGPTSRTAEARSWRSDAVAALANQWRGGGVLVVFVPEPRATNHGPSHDDHRIWQLWWGDRADVVLFWLSHDPGAAGHTVYDDFGRWTDSGRVVFGAPTGAEHVCDQCGYVREHHIPRADTLADTVYQALEHIRGGARRRGGQRHVPLLLWRTDSFQHWLATQQTAGNELRSGRLEWTYRVGPNRETVLFWAFHAAVWVAAEQREKTNEIVVSRPDLFSVVAYRRAAELADTEVVLVREFRSCASTADGFVRELPGGSTSTPIAANEQAAAELAEETGIQVSPDRLRLHQARQPTASVAAYQQHVFSVELTREELQLARTEPLTAHGVADDTERTYVELHRFGDLVRHPAADWATLGATTEVLLTVPEEVS